MKSKKLQEDNRLELTIKSAKERIKAIERTRTEIIENYFIKIEKVKIETDKAIQDILKEVEKERKKNRKFFIKTLFNNSEQKVKVIAGLEVGDKVKCIKQVIGFKGELSTSRLFAMRNLVEGKMYEVKETFIWNGTKIAYVVNEKGLLDWVSPEIFIVPGYKIVEK